MIVRMVGKGKEINITLGKNVQLLGFDVLEPSEMAIVNDLLQNYVKKIENKTDYELFRLALKMHQKSKTFIHELKAELFIHPGMSIGSTVSGKNLYKVTAEVIKNLLSELEHLNKKSIRNRPIRKLSRKII